VTLDITFAIFSARSVSISERSRVSVMIFEASLLTREPMAEERAEWGSIWDQEAAVLRMCIFMVRMVDSRSPVLS
jgi:hypothetical protein